MSISVTLFPISRKTNALTHPSTFVELYEEPIGFHNMKSTVQDLR